MSIRQVMSHVLEQAQYELGNYKRENKEMTTHDRDKIIAAAKEADSGFTGDESFNLGTSLVGLEAVECFYAIAFEAGAASRDAEVAELKAELETERCLSFRNQVADIESERDQLREQVKLLRDVVNDALSGMGGGYAIWSPRAQEALAATESRSTK